MGRIEAYFHYRGTTDDFSDKCICYHSVWRYTALASDNRTNTATAETVN
jgi:hypothetical protein